MRLDLERVLRRLLRTESFLSTVFARMVEGLEHSCLPWDALVSIPREVLAVQLANGEQRWEAQLG